MAKKKKRTNTKDTFYLQNIHENILVCKLRIQNIHVMMHYYIYRTKNKPEEEEKILKKNDEKKK